MTAHLPDRTRLRARLAKHRHHPVLRTMSSAAGKLVNATRNLDNWEFTVNGEQATVAWVVDRYPGDVFDVGSNAGQWVTAALPFVGDRTVHCFEPVPSTYGRLAALDLPEQVHRNNLGLGAERGSIELHFNPEVTEVTSRYALPDFYRSADEQLVEVAVLTGDEYCEQHGVDQISLLKIDVEGMEFEALSGFRGMLADGRIGAVQFEYGVGYIGARRYLQDMAELLTSHGFTLNRQFPDGHEPFEYTFADEDFRARNFVATRPLA